MPRAWAGGREPRHKFLSQHGEAWQWSAQRPALPLLAVPSLILLVPMDTRWSDPPHDLGPLQSRWAVEGDLPGVPPATLQMTPGHPWHPEHPPDGDIALGTGPSMAPLMGAHHPEMVMATRATSRGSQAGVLQLVSRVPHAYPSPFTARGAFAVGEPSPHLSSLYTPGSLVSVPIICVSGWDHIRAAEGPDQTSWGLWWWRKGVRAPEHPGEGGPWLPLRRADSWAFAQPPGKPPRSQVPETSGKFLFSAP